ncbi:hypothetical protein A616_17145 [Brevibacillus brevis X23]|nr:hypothetical protein A616_17145 [Brevibacillus brevis X23]
MYTFYVVLRHNDTGIFSNIYYRTDNEILTERDLMKIDEHYADKSRGVIEVKTQIISWQRLADQN